MIDGESEKKSVEINELQKRIAVDETKEEEARREAYTLKQRIVETEATKNSLAKEFCKL